MPRARRVAVLLFVLSLLAAAQSAPSGKRNITEKDLFDFNWIGSPAISPDGSRVAFVRVNVDEKRTGYETSIWSVATNANAGANGSANSSAPVRLTNGKHDSHPVWSPDGSHLAIIRSPEKDGKPQDPQIAIMSLSGGEAWIITDMPKGAGAPVWSPDGKRIAFLSDTTPEEWQKAQKKSAKKDESKPDSTKPENTKSTAATPDKNAAKEGESEHESDVRIINRAVYRFNGTGWIDYKHHSHIWVVDVPQTSDETTTPRMLTQGDYDEDDVFWSPDGSRIYFSTSHIDEPYYEAASTDIYYVPAAGGEPQKLYTIPLGADGITPSPDGRRIAFVASAEEPVRSYSEPDMWVMDLTPGAKPENLTTDFDFDIGSGVGGDNRAPRGDSGMHPIWTRDGKSLLTTAEVKGRTNLVRVDIASKKISDVTTGTQAVLGYTASTDGSKIVALMSSPVMITDLFAVENGKVRRLTDINQKLFSQLNLTLPEEIWYTSFDGKKIQAWVQKPPDFDPSKKYPLILNIHGGPHTAYGWVFDHEFQWMAAKGYVVLYPNPRGSTSYGQEFGNIIQYHYPGDDYKDLMAGVDELLKRGYIDEKKLGVTGGSGGGVLTDWTVTQTDRFAAAVAQRDISDWTSWWYTADFTLFRPSWFKAPPFQDPQDYRNRSAITYVEKIHTPMMFILGDRDYRTPPTSGGEQLFRALKFLKRPTVMVNFPGESHELSRSGQPWHRIERLENIVNWFDKYLMGKPEPQYDLRPEKEVENKKQPEPEAKKPNPPKQ